MESKVPCKTCGVAILPATAERNSGQCAICFNDPAGIPIRAAQAFGKRTPTATLLQMVEAEVTQAALRIAESAASALANEQIYGCWLFQTQFLFIDGLTIFTEAGLDQVTQSYRERGTTSSREQLRWSPCDSPHHLYLPNEFRRAEDLILSLEEKRYGDEDAAISSEVERICLRVLGRLRDASFFEPRVVLTLAEGDQGFEQRVAYAELFSSQEALEIFRSEVQPLNEQAVDHWRSQIPSF